MKEVQESADKALKELALRVQQQQQAGAAMGNGGAGLAQLTEEALKLQSTSELLLQDIEVDLAHMAAGNTPKSTPTSAPLSGGSTGPYYAAQAAVVGPTGGSVGPAGRSRS